MTPSKDPLACRRRINYDSVSVCQIIVAVFTLCSGFLLPYNVWYRSVNLTLSTPVAASRHLSLPPIIASQQHLCPVNLTATALKPMLPSDTHRCLYMGPTPSPISL